MSDGFTRKFTFPKAWSGKAPKLCTNHQDGGCYAFRFGASNASYPEIPTKEFHQIFLSIRNFGEKYTHMNYDTDFSQYRDKCFISHPCGSFPIDSPEYQPLVIGRELDNDYLKFAFYNTKNHTLYMGSSHPGTSQKLQTKDKTYKLNNSEIAADISFWKEVEQQLRLFEENFI